MASQSEGGGKEELKTHFVTREGTYKLMPLSEYTKPNRTAYNGQVNAPVKVSFINVNDGSQYPDRICFNVGRELFFYVYKNVRKAADLTKAIDKRIYKGTFPTCHDFNPIIVSPESVKLLVGFTAGQVQLIDPIKKEQGKLFNEERMIDKTKVTAIKWIPGSVNQFLVSHSSGQMYVYNEELPCGQNAPHYQLFKQGEGYAVYTCKTKSTRNPLYRWVIGQGSINEFAFSPCCKFLAVACQDGFLRVFNFDSMDLVGSMKSYFGGLLCVCWSPDGKYIVIGGEDDLVTVWSFHEKRVICRGQGHKSWVGVVAFDPYTSVLSDCSLEHSYTDNDLCSRTGHGPKQDAMEGLANGGTNSKSKRNSYESPCSKTVTSVPSLNTSSNITTYRFGSIGQDTVLCLWDLTEDMMKQPPLSSKSRTSLLITSNSLATASTLPRSNNMHSSKANFAGHNDTMADGHGHFPMVNANTKFNTLSAVSDKKDCQDKKEHKRNFSLASRSDKSNALKSNHVRQVDDSVKLLGTNACPRLDEVPILEPLVCKKISVERLTALVFREDCIVTACQDGLVNTWARPGKHGLSQHTVMSPQASVGEMYPM